MPNPVANTPAAHCIRKSSHRTIHASSVSSIALSMTREFGFMGVQDSERSPISNRQTRIHMSRQLRLRRVIRHRPVQISRFFEKSGFFKRRELWAYLELGKVLGHYEIVLLEISRLPRFFLFFENFSYPPPMPGLKGKRQKIRSRIYHSWDPVLTAPIHPRMQGRPCAEYSAG